MKRKLGLRFLLVKGQTVRRLGAALLLLALLAVSAPTQAQPTSRHTDAPNQFSVDLPLGFVLRANSEALGSFQNDQGVVMALSRISYPALPAWRKKQRDAFFDKIAEGAKSSSRDYHQKSKRYQRVDGVPVLDLHFTRKGSKATEFVWMRFLLYRKFTIVASAALPRSAGSKLRKSARAFPHSLRPVRP